MTWVYGAEALHAEYDAWIDISTAQEKVDGEGHE